MLENGVVALTNANGSRLAIQLSDGTYALVEQMGTSNVVEGATVAGDLRVFGETDLKESASKIAWKVFVIAYDLSHEAVEQAMR